MAISAGAERSGKGRYARPAACKEHPYLNFFVVGINRP